MKKRRTREERGSINQFARQQHEAKEERERGKIEEVLRERGGQGERGAGRACGRDRERGHTHDGEVRVKTISAGNMRNDSEKKEMQTTTTTTGNERKQKNMPPVRGAPHTGTLPIPPSIDLCGVLEPLIPLGIPTQYVTRNPQPRLTRYHCPQRRRHPNSRVGSPPFMLTPSPSLSPAVPIPSPITSSSTGSTRTRSGTYNSIVYPIAKA
jgi:hypothetical protein